MNRRTFRSRNVRSKTKTEDLEHSKQKLTLIYNKFLDMVLYG